MFTPATKREKTKPIHVMDTIKKKKINKTIATRAL